MIQRWPIRCRCGAISADADEWAALAPLARHAFMRRLLGCADCPPAAGLVR